MAIIIGFINIGVGTDPDETFPAPVAAAGGTGLMGTGPLEPVLRKGILRFGTAPCIIMTANEGSIIGMKPAGGANIADAFLVLPSVPSAVFGESPSALDGFAKVGLKANGGGGFNCSTGPHLRAGFGCSMLI
jgi:hypothetical protein